MAIETPIHIDGLLAWARRQRREWMAQVEPLSDRVVTTSELRDGVQVDTTGETLLELMIRIAEIDELIIKHEGRND
jgi:hypothetical protein